MLFHTKAVVLVFLPEVFVFDKRKTFPFLNPKFRLFVQSLSIQYCGQKRHLYIASGNRLLRRNLLIFKTWKWTFLVSVFFRIQTTYCSREVFSWKVIELLKISEKLLSLFSQIEKCDNKICFVVEEMKSERWKQSTIDEANPSISNSKKFSH